MWQITRKSVSPNSETEVQFLVGKEYIVGRKDCLVLIKDDPSISRKHATLIVHHDIDNLGDISKIPELTVADSSKYGTSVNGTKITQPAKLNHGDEIHFGTHSSIYRVSYNPLIVVTSCLDSNKKKLLKKQIHSLGGHLVNEWKTGHITHLVMDGLVFTIKVIHALAECSVIVTPSFFDEAIKAIETKQPLQTPKMFLPPLQEESIKSDEPLFVPDKKRKTLFKGKTFYFLSQKQFKRTHEAIEMCSGQTVLLELTSSLLHDDRLNDGCVMMMDQKERDGLITDNKELISQLMDFLRSNDKRPIPESELGLAILHITLKNYCNPNIDAVPAITQNVVCQSLNFGLDDMSQVYSPQHKHHSQQFKNPTTSKDQNGSKAQFERKTIQRITSMFTPKRSQDKQTTNKERKRSAVETPEHAMKSDKPKQAQPVTPIPDTLNISNERNVFVAETPTRKSPKSSTSSFFTCSTNNDHIVQDSLVFEKSPSNSGVEMSAKSNVIIKENAWSSDLTLDQRSNKEDVIIVKSSKKTGICVSDSEAFDESESYCTGNKHKNSVSNVKEVEIRNESSRLNVNKTEWDTVPKAKNTEKCQLSSRNVPNMNAANQVKLVIPDSLGLDNETSDFNTTQAFMRDTKEKIVQDTIPDSVGFYESSQEIANVNSLPSGTSTKRRQNSKTNNGAKRLKQIDDSCREPTNKNHAQTPSEKWEKVLDCNDAKSYACDEETALTSQTNSIRISSKRRRMTEDDSDYEMRHRASPMKRVRNYDPEIHGSEVKNFILDRREGRKKEDVGKRSGGFLVSRKVDIFKPNHQEATKTVKVVLDGDRSDNAADDDNLPCNLVVVDVVPLVVRKPKERKDPRQTKTEQTGKNFKKFKKANREQERRDRVEQELFMSDIGLPQRRTRR